MKLLSLTEKENVYDKECMPRFSFNIYINERILGFKQRKQLYVAKLSNCLKDSYIIVPEKDIYSPVKSARTLLNLMIPSKSVLTAKNKRM